MIHAYRVLSNLLYPIFVIFVYFRKLIKKEDPLRFKEKILISHFNVKREEK
jgi:3-deoxy-D-manno-octulosonic-acid transferase